MCPLTFLMEVSRRYWAKQGALQWAGVLFPRVSLSAALWSVFAVHAQGPGRIPQRISLNLTFVLSGHTGAIPQLSGRIISELFCPHLKIRVHTNKPRLICCLLVYFPQ